MAPQAMALVNFEPYVDSLFNKLANVKAIDEYYHSSSHFPE
jgi:hypothetical protein